MLNDMYTMAYISFNMLLSMFNKPFAVMSCRPESEAIKLICFVLPGILFANYFSENNVSQDVPLKYFLCL